MLRISQAFSRSQRVSTLDQPSLFSLSFAVATRAPSGAIRSIRCIRAVSAFPFVVDVVLLG